MTVGAQVLQCFSSIQCLAYLEAGEDAPAAESFQPHLDSCERCRVLVAEMARALFATEGAAPSRAVRTLGDGEVLGGRYEIRRFIARGGMGEVYEAFDQTLGECVALKTLAPTTLDQPGAAASLIAEVRLARKVMHPNVCRIFEFGIHRRSAGDAEVVPFLTMELLKGETLGSRLRREGPLEHARALQILRELCDGLAAVHRAGIVHRDFKTENVFLSESSEGRPERAVVMDFGLARALDVQRGSRHSSAHLLVGTVAYMAPEQVEGARPAPAFDVYALGTVAFEMLCGRLPFMAESQLALATLRLRHEPPPPSEFRPRLMPGWDWFVASCLARDTDSRFRTMDEVGSALARVERGDLPAARRAMAWFRRPIAIGIGMALLLAGGTLAAVLSRGGRAVSFAERPTAPSASVHRPPVEPAATIPPSTVAPAAMTAGASNVTTSPLLDAASSAVSPGTAPKATRPTGASRVSSRSRSGAVGAPTAGASAALAPAGRQATAPVNTDDDFIDPFSHLRDH